MTKLDAGGLNAESAQCFVCEKAAAGGDWFARVKHGDQTIVLCSEQCADAFYARRLPFMRRLVALATLQSAPGPYGQGFSPLNEW
jgi:hypothetical protein